ncbi:hypothetical protein [Micromonospora eburnea]|uniref:Uncharacterized protein n=1 Tax=Micromonospora eburnea TaxID=227316 RepID=A0A1C6UYB3_9ACTN|nr:hypothetical protein [Micromonospora eburnea]SCL59011.1 hypothetical protein GA0070604_3960 [Micromonospora eburnea]
MTSTRTARRTVGPERATEPVRLSSAFTETPWSLSTWYPVALLPVRLESRFSGATLRIRVFPDQIHVDSHEPGLTEAEEAAGRAYWADLAGGGPTATDPAWTELVRLFGAARAGWIARVMEPDADGDPLDPLSRPAPWTEPARARLLPSRWYAVGRTVDGVLFTGVSQPVTRDPAVSLTPVLPGEPESVVPADVPPGLPPVDAGMRWLVDYEAAVSAGMAFPVEVPTDAGGRPRPVERLLVFGVDDATGPDDAAWALHRLLEAHAATDGLGFLPPGTPTNHTETVTVPGHATVAPVTAADEVPGGVDPANESAAALVSRALAVPLLSDDLDDDLSSARRRTPRSGAPTALARAAHAGLDERPVERLVRQVLWHPGLGNTLRHLLPVATPAEQEQIREHFVAHVHPEGPLPTLRIGSQPYGLLPVAALRGWQTADPGERRAVTVLENLWRRAWLAGPAPRIRPGLADPEQTLLEILAADARAVEVRARSVLGNEYVSWLWRFLRLDLDASWQEQVVEPGRALLSALGLAGETDPRLALAVFARKSFALGTPLLDGPEAVDPARVRAYLDALAAVPLRGDRIPDRSAPDRPVPLLYRLLRAALIAEHSAAAGRLATLAGLPGAAEIPEPELVDVRARERTATLARRLAITVPGSGGLDVGDYLAGSAPDDDRHRQATAELTAFRSALTRLADALVPPPPDPTEPQAPPKPLDPADLERYVAGTLGLTAHRLDAWITSLATIRLDRLAASRPADLPAGLHVGAYGWVTDLVPAPPPVLVDRPAHVPASEAGPKLLAAPADAGHVHAPSQPQAVTAAVLRSAWRSHGGGADNPVAVDLSSRRVRTAEQILAGLRDGQPLGALLGYRFERGLHDHPRGALDQYVPLFRDLAPVRAHRVDPSPDGRSITIASTTESTAVTDGLELHRLHRAGALDAKLATLPGAASEALGDLLAGLADDVDAVGDALLAEGVHQLAAGDLNRAAAALDAAAGAAGHPPELHFSRTPDGGGVTVTHRVALLFHLDDRFGARRVDWPAGRSEQPRIIGAAVDALVAALLPSANRVYWRMRWHAPDGAEVTPYVAATLDYLGMAAVDHVAAPPHPGAPAGTDLDRRIELVAWTRFAPRQVTPQWRLELNYEPTGGSPSRSVSLSEFLTAVAALRDLFGRSRQLLAADLGAEPDVPPQFDTETRHAADELWQLARATATALRELDPPSAPADDDAAVRRLLRTAAGFGVVGVEPPPPGPASAAVVAEAVRYAGDELTRRIAAHCAVVAGPRGRTPCPPGVCGCVPATDFDDPTAPPQARRDLQVARIRALLGADAPVLSLSRAPDPVTLAAALAASADLQGGTPHAVRRWLTRYGRVRPAVGRLQEVLAFAEVLDAGGAVRVPARVQVAQLPYQDGDRWVGETAPRPDTRPISLVLATLGDLDPHRPVYGLLVDEWTEVVPAATALTGLTFEYDAPAAAAPQAVLLGVSSDGAPTWQPAALVQTLEEALDLAIARVTDVDSLGAGGQFLPALYLPVNVAQPGATTDFAPDAATLPTAGRTTPTPEEQR